MNRRDKVLKLIVEYFIKNAEPVGSQTLIDEYGLDYSSATIRSEMNALEQDGLLEKTHASSGRVPSSKGYRYYIKHLRERSVDEEFKYRVTNILQEKIQSIDEVIKQSCEILSEMTSLASIVLGPKSNEEKLVSVQIVPISNNSATCVFVTSQGYVENKTFVFDEKHKSEDIEGCVKLLNERLKGTAISELVPKMQAIKPLLSEYIVDHDVVYQAMMEAFIGFAKDRLSTYGQGELFEQPEFAHDADKIKKLLELFHSPTAFREVIKGETQELDDDIAIHIGGESVNDEDVSIVTAKISVPGRKEGNIAIVGPKRMDYDKVVSNMEYLIKELEKYFDNNVERKEVNKSERKEKQNRKQTN